MAGLLHPERFAGRVHQHVLTSEVLDGGRWGDPTTRHLYVYEPPGDHGPLPVVLLLPGFTGASTSFLEVHPWKPGVVQVVDRAVAAERAAPALLVLPDCWTRLGGSQFVNSPSLGRYTDHLVDEVVPFVRAHHDALPGGVGVCGKSSGGFGAMHLSLDHPDVFRAAGSISGDVDFELGYAAEFPAACRGLVDHGTDPAAFLAAFLEDPTLEGDDHAVLNTLAMAACYAPTEADPGFELPFDLHTCARRPEVWARWLAFDPLQRIEADGAQEAWRSLTCLHLECGLKDQFHLQWGLRKLSARLDALGIPHDHVEHPGSHFDINDRYPPLIDKLARALAAD